MRGDNWAGRPGAPDVQGQSRLEAWTHTNTYKVSGTLRDTQQACVHEMDKDTHIHKQQTQFVWRVQEIVWRVEDSVWTLRLPAGRKSPKAPPSRPSFSIFLILPLVAFNFTKLTNCHQALNCDEF